MNKANKSSRVILFIITIMMATVAAGCSSRFVSPDTKSSPAGQTQATAPVSQRPTQVRSNNEGAVTIDLNWQSEKITRLEFSVTMDTHSVNLDQYDLGKLAVLRDGAGTESLPLTWDSAAGGHHRTGTLAFPLPDSVSQSKAQYFEIVIRDVDSIKERVFKWEL